METEFVILHVKAKRMEHRTVWIQTGPNKRKATVINTKMKTMPHPIRTKEGLTTERRIRGTDNHQSKTAQISEMEMVFVTKLAQKVEDPRKETVKDREEGGLAPFLLFLFGETP